MELVEKFAHDIVFNSILTLWGKSVESGGQGVACFGRGERGKKASFPIMIFGEHLKNAQHG